MSNAVKDGLNKIVATQGLLYTKLHQYHWYIKGAHFFALHEKYEELYDKTTEDFDEVAERLLTIGGEPYSTLGEFIEHSVIEENVSTKELKEANMVRSSINDLSDYTDLLGEVIEITEEHGDDVSNDLLIAMKGEVEKSIWMLQAYLGNEATEEVEDVEK